MHSAGALYVTHPHSQVGYRWEAPKVSSPEDSQELRPAPAPALPLRPRPSRRSRPRPAASGRRGVAQTPRRALEAPAGAPPPHLRRARPPAPPTVAIKGKRAARSPRFVRRLGSASVYSSVFQCKVASQTAAAKMVKQIESKVSVPGPARARRAAPAGGVGGGPEVGRPPLRIPGGRGRGDSAWDCEEPGPGRSRGGGACPGGLGPGNLCARGMHARGERPGVLYCASAPSPPQPGNRDWVKDGGSLPLAPICIRTRARARRWRAPWRKPGLAGCHSPRGAA